MTSGCERHDRYQLWLLTAAPGIWAIHFLASYLTAAIYCAKFAGADGSAGPVQVAIIIYTLVALVAIAAVGRVGARLSRTADDTDPMRRQTGSDREGRRQLVGWATYLLSLLSGVATIFTALVAVFVGSCH